MPNILQNWLNKTRLSSFSSLQKGSQPKTDNKEHNRQRGTVEQGFPYENSYILSKSPCSFLPHLQWLLQR